MTSERPFPIPDTRFYNQNRCSHSPESLLVYAGRTIAWTADGTQVVAAGDDFLTLWNQLKADGHDPSQYVYEDMPAEGEDTFL